MRAQFVEHGQSGTGVLLPTCESRLAGRWLRHRGRLLRIELLGGLKSLNLHREEGRVFILQA